MAAPDDPVVDLEQQLGVLLRRARGFSRQMAGRVHPDLEAGPYGILVRLADSGGSRLTDLSTYFGVGKPTLSRQVRQLEELGLVERVDDEHDARAQLLRLTADGDARLAAARDKRRERFRELLGEWQSGDVRRLADLLARFNSLHD